MFEVDGDIYEQLSKGQRSPPDIFVTVVKF